MKTAASMGTFTQMVVKASMGVIWARLGSAPISSSVRMNGSGLW